MSKPVVHNGQKITFFDCKDCGMVMHTENGLRPNRKFCDKRCKDFVVKNKLYKSSVFLARAKGEAK
jgi:hypothetical protein